jgi:hypothetical protein
LSGKENHAMIPIKLNWRGSMAKQPSGKSDEQQGDSKQGEKKPSQQSDWPKPRTEDFQYQQRQDQQQQ